MQQPTSKKHFPSTPKLSGQWPNFRLQKQHSCKIHRTFTKISVQKKGEKMNVQDCQWALFPSRYVLLLDQNLFTLRFFLLSRNNPFHWDRCLIGRQDCPGFWNEQSRKCYRESRHSKKFWCPSGQPEELFTGCYTCPSHKPCQGSGLHEKALERAAFKASAINASY